MSAPLPPRGRGTATNLHNRFAPTVSVAEDDGWHQEVPPTQGTEVRIETAKTIITRNNSPDLPFDRSINPYRGCEHGCIYCYARPSHAYWDMSPGLDFETKLIAKTNAADVLEQQLSKPGYVCAPINLGSNTDPYQPIEREYKITRQTLEVLLRYRHPVTIITKGSLILRDLDLLTELARQRLVAVMISLTSLDDELKRILEPRTAAPKARLRAIRVMREAGIPVGVLCSPMIPMINDSELESLLTDAHVMSLVRQVRGGEVYDSRFGVRMRGEGPFADLLAQRFSKAIKRLGLDRREGFNLDCTAFCPPGRQMALL